MSDGSAASTGFLVHVHFSVFPHGAAEIRRRNDISHRDGERVEKIGHTGGVIHPPATGTNV